MEHEEDAIFNDAKTLGSKDIKEVWKIVSAFLSDSGFKESSCALLPTCCVLLESVNVDKWLTL